MCLLNYLNGIKIISMGIDDVFSIAIELTVINIPPGVFHIAVNVFKIRYPVSMNVALWTVAYISE